MGTEYCSQTTRRHLFKLAGATAVVSAALQPGSVRSQDAASEKNASSARAASRFLVDCHVHVGAVPSVAALSDKIHSPRDWIVERSKRPELFADMVSGKQIDNSNALLAIMDENGVTHAIIQAVPGRDSTNQKVADIAKRHPGRLFATYRPEIFTDALGAGTLSNEQAKAAFSANARRIADDIEKVFPAIGLIGVGELIPGGVVTDEIHPVKISRDLAPIMEALQPKKVPIQFPTSSSAWKGGLYYLYEPIWVDEVAGNFPDVPIILTKMGRGIRGSFDACLVVAMRNDNVFFDMTDSTSEHLREAVDRIGARRIMFGTDLSGISLNYAYDMALQTIAGAQLSQEEWEWIAWRSADSVYQLGLGA